uniref:Uncharacterized protein n=1 Tax=viral metagenome TaxID=1070528 RepID=A0A6C0CGM0_9ZZZZ
MEEHYAFFHRGNLLALVRESGERKVRYSMRINFIMERVGKYDLRLLEEYSRVYADMVLFGLEYPERVTSILGRMINLNKAEKEVEDQEDNLMILSDNLTGSIITEQTDSSIKFDIRPEAGDEARDPDIELSMEIAEVKGAFFRAEPNANLVGGIVESVAFEASSPKGERSGIVLTVKAGDETVRLQTCSDAVCTEPADIVATISPEDEKVFIQAAADESTSAEEKGTLAIEEPSPDLEQEYGVPKIASPRGDARDPTKAIIIEEDVDVAIDQPAPICKFIDRELPQPSRDIIMHRFNGYLMRGSLIEFKDSILSDLFEAYNVGIFGGELSKAIREDRLKIEMKWTEDSSAPLAAADISGILCTLTLSKAILSKMGGTRKGKHEIFGMPCTTQFEVIMILVESFCTLVATELCEMGDRYAEYARKIFGHEGSDQKIAPPDGEVRLRIMELKKDPTAVVKVTLNDNKEYEVAGARSLTEVLLIDGTERKRAPYSDITHIDGQAI